MAQFDLLLLKIKELIQVTKSSGSNNSSTNTSDSSAIRTNTADSKMVLDAILVELKDDIGISETVWYDKTDITKFYVRKASLNQDTQVIIISFQNIDGSNSTPIISNLVQTVVNTGIIEANLTSINSKLPTTGQGSISTSLPVVLPDSQITALKSITSPLPSGTNIIGKVSIDQTTQGVTNFVTNNQTQKLGTSITVSNGLITSNTERVILANRIETILGGIETITDISTGNGQRIKALTFTNNSANIIFLQIYNKSTALVTGDVPMNGLIFRVPSNSTLDKTVADFGETGILYGSNTRIGISSTFATFTAITPTNTSINIITVA